MSETRFIAIPAVTRKKLLELSQRFGELNTGSESDTIWLASDDGNSGYDWGQVDLGITKSGFLTYGYQSGCSCNGPEAPSADQEFDLRKPIKIKDDPYYGALEPAVKELASVARVLDRVFKGTATAKEIISLPNAEIRRAAIERVGYEKLTKHATIVDESYIDGSLMVIKLESDEPLTLLHVKDPSTTREYFLRVPPQMKTARQARAWTFGFEAGDFVLEKES